MTPLLIGSPDARATSMRGRTPQASTSSSAASTLPSSSRTPSTAASPTTASMVRPVRTKMPCDSIWRSSISPPSSSSWAFISVRAACTTVTCSPASLSTFAASSPRSPPPSTTAASPERAWARIRTQSSIVR